MARTARQPIRFDDLPDRSYLYVIGMGPRDPVKVGRSKSPARRRNSLQTGAHGKLVVLGAEPVAQAEAPALEGLAQQILQPLQIQGEVFQASAALALAVIRHVARGGKPDEFLKAAVAHEVASNAYSAITRMGEHKGRWATEEAKAACRAALEAGRAARDLARTLDEIRYREIWPATAAIGTAQWRPAARSRFKGGCVV